MNKKIKAARLSIASNTVLVAGKLIIGFAIGSVGVISEGIHSSVDLLASIVAFAAVRAASRPADEKHPYGHGKYENISGSIEAALIFVAALWIIYESIERLYHPVQIENVGLGIAVMLLSSVINFFISKHLMKVGKETDSIALQADAMHLKTDVIASAGVMAGLIGVYFTGISWIDSVAAILVAFLLIHASYELFTEAFSPLMDARLDATEEDLIHNSILKYQERFIDFHDLRTRKSGSERHIDFHMTVCKHQTIAYAHTLADDIENEIQHHLDEANILIHQEPCEGECEGCALANKNIDFLH
jgi:cation diffusion facilitator family transporter